eukprot:403373145
MQLKYAKLENAEFNIEGTAFEFYLKPYHLKLNFSHPLSEDSASNKSAFDVDKGIMTCQIAKLNPGDIFEDLDMITKLLQDSKTDFSEFEEGYEEENQIEEEQKKQAEPKIQVLQSTTFVNQVEEEEKKSHAGLEFLENHFAYGFLNQYSDIFEGKEDLLLTVADLDPTKVPIQKRTLDKIAIETEKFDEERYAFDNFDDEAIQQAQEYIHLDLSWPEEQKSSDQAQIQQQLENLTINDENQQAQNVDSVFTKEQQDILVELKKIEVLKPALDEQATLFAQLIDLLFAYCYDRRVTQSEGGEPSVESAFNIIRLSSTLASFIDYRDFQSVDKMRVKFVMIFSLRRALIFTMLRNFELARQVMADLVKLIHHPQAKTLILKALVHLHQVFSHKYYLYNRCFIDEMCVWFQHHVKEEDMERHAVIVKECFEEIDKHDLNLRLEIVDQMAKEYKENGGEDEDDEDSDSESESSEDDDDKSEDKNVLIEEAKQDNTNDQ